MIRNAVVRVIKITVIFFVNHVQMTMAIFSMIEHWYLTIFIVVYVI